MIQHLSKRFPLSILILMASITICIGQEVHQDFMLRGMVYSIEDSVPLQLISVINLRAHIGTPSGIDGSFALAAADGDSIRFKAVNYDDFYVVARAGHKDGLKVYLKPSNHELNMVTITPYGEREYLRKSFVELSRHDRGDTTHIHLKSGISGGSAPIPSGFSIGWDPLGNSIRRQNAVIDRWIRREQLDALAATKYNKEFVKGVTGCTNEEVEVFMKYCNLRTEFILSVTDYELGVAVKRCYYSYQKQDHSVPTFRDIHQY